MNLRPPGPQPGALPDCATPRGRKRFYGCGDLEAVRSIYEHLFVSAPKNLRRCGRCGQSKSVDEFAWRTQAKGQRDNYSRPCRADYKQEHYANNRARYVEQAGRRRQLMLLQRTILLVAFSRSHPCAEGGETDPVELEFDHRGDRTFEITRGIRERSAC